MNSTGKRINVTECFVPPLEEYTQLLEEVWKSRWLTNGGPKAQALEKKLQELFGSPYVLFTGNGTIAIQLAIKALSLSGEIITTPYSYCATTTSILWENATPVFVDVHQQDFNINAELIEAAITPATTAILATHVYGFPCDVDSIEAIAKKHNLAVIYDAAHCFGVKLRGKSLLAYGDIATCSFHATKVFHTGEGGCIVSHEAGLHQRLYHLRSFGHVNDDYYSIGINGKNSEMHASLGLVNLNYVEHIIANRKQVFEWYDKRLNWQAMRKPTSRLTDFEYNYAYYPVVFESVEAADRVMDVLVAEEIVPRRYFYPSLNKLGYLTGQAGSYECPVSESAAGRVLSLPLSTYIAESTVAEICQLINSTL